MRRWNQMHCFSKGLSFRDWIPRDKDLFDFLGPSSYFKVPIFNVLAKFTLRMSIQSACTQQWVNLICAVFNHNLRKEMVSIFVATACSHCPISLGNSANGERPFSPGNSPRWGKTKCTKKTEGFLAYFFNLTSVTWKRCRNGQKIHFGQLKGGQAGDNASR